MPDNPGRIAVSDEQLVAAVLQGDISTFGSIVERYWKMATGLALSRTRNTAEAENGLDWLFRDDGDSASL